MNIPVDPPRENSRAGGGDIHTNSIVCYRVTTDFVFERRCALKLNYGFKKVLSVSTKVSRPSGKTLVYRVCSFVKYAYGFTYLTGKVRGGAGSGRLTVAGLL